MPGRFCPGDAVYAQDGRRYIVDDVDDGVVYCVSSGGAETEFSEAQVMTEAEWTARSSGRSTLLYGRLKQAWVAIPVRGKPDRPASEQLLVRAERLFQGILDFTAFVAASRLMVETRNQDFVADLSIKKCREIFDGLSPEIRMTLFAGIMGSTPEILLNAAALRDNLMRAMIEKGLASSSLSFDAFCARSRN